jgi:hypothetical protein
VTDRDLFGEIQARLAAPPLTPLERKRLYRKAAEVPRGHAARPGTGPAGETCGTCRHLYRTQDTARPYRKCELNRAAWTGGPKTDVRASDAARRRHP